MDLPRRIGFWGFAVAILVAADRLLTLAHAPAPEMIAGAVAGCVCGLAVSRPRRLPESVRSVALAVIAAAAGAHVTADVLRVLADRPIEVLAAVAATIGLSLAASQLLRISGQVSPQTALLAGVAGGASGAAAIARDLDADEPVVLALQYLRVLVVLATLPIAVTRLGAHPVTDVGAMGRSPWAGMQFTVCAVAVGLAMTRLLRFSGNRMVLPLAASVALTMTGWFGTSEVPAHVVDVGNAAIGLMVGLVFTRAALRRLSGVLPLALAQVALSITGAAGIGLILADVAHVSPVDGYLATTPGGLPTVTGIALGSNVNVGFVVTAQVLRMVFAMLLAVLLGAFLGRRARARSDL